MAASIGEFEIGIGKGGRTEEKLHLLNAFGVTQVVVAVNKMDEMEWSQQRFNYIVEEMTGLFKRIGAQQPLHFVPISAWNGDNLKGPIGEVAPWYQGPSLFEVFIIHLDFYCA